jgi:hypothetical protein
VPFVSVPRHVRETALWRKPIWLKAWLWLRLKQPFGTKAGDSFMIHWLDVREAVPELTPDNWSHFLRWARDQKCLSIERADGNNRFRVTLFDLPAPGAPPATQLPLLPAPASAGPTPAAKPAQAHGSTWVTPYGAVWTKIMGGDINWKLACKYLAPVHKAHGVDVVSLHLENYLRSTGPQFVSLPKFAETFGCWSKKGSPNGSKRKASDSNESSDYA